MTLAPSPPQQIGTPSATSGATQGVSVAPTQRDIRLDFFRGIAMFIILIAHIPGNRWSLWLPARFGFSDATEIFVFCSGMASAIAFGRVFRERGLGMGSARVGYRIWQVYWAHIGLFVALAATMAALTNSGLFERDYIRSLNLQHFFADPEVNIVGLVTLTYVPNYFDILPMYMVVLAMMPLVVALARFSVYAAGALVVVLWLGSNSGLLWLPAEPWSEREWFFNPFGWQLLFFTGFAFMVGWIPAPPVKLWLMALAAGFVFLSFVLSFNWWRTFPHPEENQLNSLQQALYWLHLKTFYWREDYRFLTAKTDFGLFRYLHFLSLGYLAWALAGPGGENLRGAGREISRIRAATLAAILKVGQQSLAIFIFGMFAARMLGFALDQVGRNTITVGLINVLGMLSLVGVAYLTAWIKAQPWRSKRG